MKKTLIYSLLVALAASAQADFSVTLSFDDGTLNNGSTGTFSISGFATSIQGGSSGWSAGASSNNFAGDNLPANSAISFTATSVANDPGFTFGGNSWNQSIVGNSFLRFSSNNFGAGTTSFSISGDSTLQGGFSQIELQIGNGTTDAFTGTFSISSTNGAPGSVTPTDLEGQQFGTEFGTTDNTNVEISTVVVPEPSTYALLTGSAFLAFTLIRRRSK